MAPRTDGPFDSPPHCGSLRRFYAALGVVVLLVLLGAWLQAPLRVWYWENAVRRACAASEKPNPEDPRGFPPIRRSARVLAAIGPRAGPALDRLLQDHELSNSEWILWGIGDADAVWALPMVVRETRNGYYDIAATALMVAGTLARREFIGEKDFYDAKNTDDGKNLYKIVGPGQERLREWWEREGLAKYGGTEK